MHRFETFSIHFIKNILYKMADHILHHASQLIQIVHHCQLVILPKLQCKEEYIKE